MKSDFPPHSSPFGKIVLALVLIGCGIAMWQRTRPPVVPPTEYIEDSQATAEFGAFFEANRPRLEAAIKAAGFHPIRQGPDAGKYRVEWYVAKARPEEVQRGEATASVAITGDDPEMPDAVAELGRMLQMEFVRFEHNAQWYLLTDRGYLLYFGASEGDLVQGVAPDVHVAVKNIFPLNITLQEKARRALRYP